MSEKLTGWQPIETAPKDGTDILLVYGEEITVARWSFSFWNTDDQDRGYDEEKFTHWMPLPELPEVN